MGGDPSLVGGCFQGLVGRVLRVMGRFQSMLRGAFRGGRVGGRGPSPSLGSVCGGKWLLDLGGNSHISTFEYN